MNCFAKMLMIPALWLGLMAGSPALAAEVEKADAPHATPAEGAAGHDAAHEEEPELIRGPAAGAVTAITTLIVFSLLFAVLTKYAWGPIASGLKAREDKIRKDIADAEAARARAEATLREYNTQLAGAETRVREMLNKAAADGEAIAANIRTRAQADAEEIKDRANREIESARVQAVGQVREEAVFLATSMAENILHRNLNPEDQRDLLARSLEQVQEINRN